MSSYQANLRFSLYLLKQSLYWLVATGGGVSLCLLIGQCVKLRAWLWPIPFDDLERYIHIIGGGYLILLEASLPLMCLISLGATYAYFKKNEIPNTWFLMGGSPVVLFFPALLIGTMTSCITIWIAHHSTPYILKEIHSDLTNLVHHTWFTPNHGYEFDFGGIRVFRHSKTQHEILIYLQSQQTLVRGFISDPQTFSVSTDSLKLRSSRLSPSTTLVLNLSDVDLWSPQGHLSVSTFHFELDQSHLLKSLTMLGPPNSLTSSELDFTHPHQAFTGYKRWSLSISALLWSFLGALLGLWPSSHQALAIGVLSISGAYSLLRYLELQARFENGSPFLAAWSPCIYLILMLGGLFLYWRKQELND